jgi:UDP-N-acetyl-2-amino-2-deoxyglucuronate dehydrogenase
VYNFAIVGASGYIAPRHLKAIYATGNQVVAALDPNDSVGLLDSYSTDIDFFTEFERFDRHVEKLRRGPSDHHVHYVSICSPNYLHDAHCRQALRAGADVICEKPLVINPWNLDALQEIELETGKRINAVLQLRLHTKLLELRERLMNAKQDRKHDVVLSYVTVRGKWYFFSWKGDIQKSGGIATNIGIHFFDMLIWLFGSVQESKVYCSEPNRMSGYLELERANIRWFLSLDPKDLPFEPQPGVNTTFRSITVDGEEVDFTQGFTDLHTRVYEEVLTGNGFGIDHIRPATELVHNLRQSTVVPHDDMTHHFLSKA